jgi:hypothetical protein
LKTGKKNKATVFAVFALTLALLLGGVLFGACAAGTSATPGTGSPSPSQTAPASAPEVSPSGTDAAASASDTGNANSSDGQGGVDVVYTNTDYGFTFKLPADWKGYTIVTQEWKGTPVDGAGQPDISGPEIFIRNPQWTKETPTQDIPIMVFTLQQWTDVQAEKYAVSAAPIPPSELGRNSICVFALPARYNYAFPAGYEEVEKILEGKPLHANESFS